MRLQKYPYGSVAGQTETATAIHECLGLPLVQVNDAAVSTPQEAYAAMYGRVRAARAR
eukprot:gene8723-45177_t